MAFGAKRHSRRSGYHPALQLQQILDEQVKSSVLILDYCVGLSNESDSVVFLYVWWVTIPVKDDEVAEKLSQDLKYKK